MNKQEFEERLHANPDDESEDFLEALKEDPTRLEMLNEAQTFNTWLSSSLNTVQAPSALKEKLLNSDFLTASEENSAQSSSTNNASENTEAANDDQFFKRLLPVAACLVLAVSIAFNYWPDSNTALEEEIFAHLYEDIELLNVEDSLSTQEMNARLSNTLPTQFSSISEISDLEITVTKDCGVANEDSIHIVMKGQTGRVTVLLIPNTPVEREFTISNERFNGIVTPTAGGNLVVIGEKQEPIEEYRRLLADNMSWEY